VELALSLGLSPRRLAGWEPTQTVRILREDLPSGRTRITGYEIEQEPEWSDEDLAILLALLELRAEEEQSAPVYGPHGRPMNEATSPDADENDRRYGWHYDVRVRVDHAQKKLNRTKRERAEAFPDEDADSLQFTLVRVDDGPPRPRPPA
jgi:hypothetical protein